MARNTLKLDVLLGSDIPDPTDFKNKSLRDLDASFACQICSEFFVTPVSLACGHTFCSLCVRSHLGLKEECPGCREPATENHLRRNVSLEDSVEAWKRARSYVLHLIEESEKPKSEKRKAVDYDSDIEEIPGPSSPKKAKTTGMVQCPICSDYMREADVYPHIDKAHGDGDNNAQKDKRKSTLAGQWQHLMGGHNKDKELQKITERLPKRSYMTEKSIKDALDEHGLGKFTLPEKQQLTSADKVKRHKQWVIFWNAEMDKAPENRKTVEGLKELLKEWENDQHQAKKLQKHYRVDDVAAHQETYKSEFENLIKAARTRKQKSPNSDVNGNAQ